MEYRDFFIEENSSDEYTTCKYLVRDNQGTVINASNTIVEAKKLIDEYIDAEETEDKELL